MNQSRVDSKPDAEAVNQSHQGLHHKVNAIDAGLKDGTAKRGFLPSQNTKGSDGTKALAKAKAKAKAAKSSNGKNSKHVMSKPAAKPKSKPAAKPKAKTSQAAKSELCKNIPLALKRKYSEGCSRCRYRQGCTPSCWKSRGYEGIR